MMVDGDADPHLLLQRLSKVEREQVEATLDTGIRIETEIIEKAIQSDKEHLTIVNFCINRFAPNSYLNIKAGYVWVRVEPLYGLGLKNFDIAIYNNITKTMVLVECKSGLREASKEVAEIEEKITIASANRNALGIMVGDEIAYLEFALCLKAGLASGAKSVMLSRNLKCCLWSADIFGSTIVLEKLKEDSVSELSSGRLHREESLRKALLEGVTEMNATRAVTFLPSSHMCSILEEVVSLLRMELDRSGDQKQEFGLVDVQNIMAREISLQNFDDPERRALAEKVALSALRAGIFDDLTPHVSALGEKKLKMISHSRSTRHLVKDCHEKYVRFHATRLAIERGVQEFRDKHRSLEGFFRK